VGDADKAGIDMSDDGNTDFHSDGSDSNADRESELNEDPDEQREIEASLFCLCADLPDIDILKDRRDAARICRQPPSHYDRQDIKGSFLA
jgi:hypothetical protein